MSVKLHSSVATSPAVARPLEPQAAVRDERRSRREVALVWISSLVMLAFLVALVVALLPERISPAPVSAAAPASEFSSARAMEHVRAIAARPHPTGTKENEQVFDYLYRTLSQLGLQVNVQPATYGEYSRAGVVYAARVRNLLAKRPGVGSGKAVLLVAHYDSAITSPGAADDGAAVATLLETARIIATGPPLRNDIYFLFTDGEELGLLGAKAFRAQDPDFQSVGLVLNFEARGTEGPAVLFETGRGSGWLVSEMIDVVPHAYASSLAPGLYELMRNNTDFTVFKNAGLPGLNFAFAENWVRYHTQLDSAVNLDERSLQHQGLYASALAKSLGDRDLDTPSKRSFVYFNVLGSLIIAYSSAWTYPLVSLGALCYCGLVAYALSRRRLKPSRLMTGLLALPAAAILTGVAAKLYLMLAVGDIPQGFILYRLPQYQSALAIIAALGTILTHLIVVRWCNWESVFLGTLFWWLLLAVVSSVILPGGSYVFAWPLVCGVGIGWLTMAGGGGATIRRIRSIALYLVPLCMAVILIPPAKMLSLAFTLGNAYLTSVYAALCLCLLAPQIKVILASRRWVAPAILASAMVILTVAIRTGAVYDVQHPKNNQVMYVQSEPSNSAAWMASSWSSDQWVSEVLSSGERRPELSGLLPAWYSSGIPRTGQLLASSAPRTDLAMPEISVQQDSTSGDERTLRLIVRSVRQAPKLAVHFEARKQVALIDVNGQKPDDRTLGSRTSADRRTESQPQQTLTVYLTGQGSMELTIRASAGPVKLQLVDQSYGLPDSLTTALQPRSPAMMPLMSIGDGAVVVRSLDL